MSNEKIIVIAGPTAVGKTDVAIGVARALGTEIVSCDRSCVASKLADVLTRHRRLAHVLEANLEITGEYPTWKPIFGSPLQEIYLRAAKEIYGVEGKVCAIHAGLECGILSDACPGMDAISIGPDLRDIHTPEESLSLASFDRLYALVKRMLA